MTRPPGCVDRSPRRRSLADGGNRLPRVAMPSNWPRIWPGSTVADWPCWNRSTKPFFERYRAARHHACRDGFRCNTSPGRWRSGPCNCTSAQAYSSPVRRPSRCWNGLLHNNFSARPVIVDLCTGSGALAYRRWPTTGPTLVSRGPSHRHRRLRHRAGLRAPQCRGGGGRTRASRRHRRRPASRARRAAS